MVLLSITSNLGDYDMHTCTHTHACMHTHTQRERCTYVLYIHTYVHKLRTVVAIHLNSTFA